MVDRQREHPDYCYDQRDHRVIDVTIRHDSLSEPAETHPMCYADGKKDAREMARRQSARVRMLPMVSGQSLS